MHTVPLTTWYSEARRDHFTTSDPDWQAPAGTTRPGRGDYRAVRVEGRVLDPERERPEGTLPLYHWWSEQRQDNFLTTDPDWAGAVGEVRSGQGDYRLFRIEGYVWERPMAGTVTLRSYWNAARKDNAASSSPFHAVWERRGSAAFGGPPYAFVAAMGYLQAELPDTADEPWSVQGLTRQYGFGRLRPPAPSVPVLFSMNDWQDVRFGDRSMAAHDSELWVARHRSSFYHRAATQRSATWTKERQFAGLLVSALASSDGRLWAATNSDQLHVRTAPGRWKQVGHANDVVAMAGSADRLWAATGNGRLWVRDPVERDVDWRPIGHARHVVAMAGLDDRLWALRRDDTLWVRDATTDGDASWDAVGPFDVLATSEQDYRDRLDELGEFSRVMSGGQFEWTHGAVVRGQSRYTTAEADVLANPGPEQDVQRINEDAVEVAAQRIDLARFAVDGRIGPGDLQIYRFGPGEGPGAQAAPSFRATIDALGVATNLVRSSEDMSVTSIAHELLHGYGSEDVYGPARDTNSGYSLMASARRVGGHTQLDPWHRMQHGWLTPTVVAMGTPDPWLRQPPSPPVTVRLRFGTDRAPGTVVLLQPEPRGEDNEYFLLEARAPGRWDTELPGTGVVVWFISQQGAEGLTTYWSGRDAALDRWVHRHDRPGRQTQAALAIGSVDGGDAGKGQVFGHGDGPISLTWPDESDTGLRLYVWPEASPRYRDVTIYQQGPWGAFIPRLDDVDPPRVQRGRLLGLRGHFPPDHATAWSARLVAQDTGAGAPLLLALRPFDDRFHAAAVTIPDDTAPGPYAVSVVPGRDGPGGPVRPTMPGAGSNALPVDITS